MRSLLVQFPFASLNLRRNPFGELTPEERAELAVIDHEPLVEFLSQPGRAVQLVGNCGRGKSSHLLGLSAKVPGGLFVRMRLHQQNPRPTACRVLLMDEVDHVSRWVRRRWARLAQSVAWAVHEDRGPELRRLGFELKTVPVDRNTEPERLGEIFSRRIEAFRDRAGEVPQLDQRAIDRLAEHHGTDIRAMEHRLYRVFQRFANGEAQWRAGETIVEV